MKYINNCLKNRLINNYWHLVLICSFLFFNCQVQMQIPTVTSSNAPNLPVKIINWVNNEYYTNDVANSGTTPSYPTTGNNFIKMGLIEIQANKLLGNPSLGYGIVFCVQPGPPYQNYYQILISNLGYYLISKYVGNVYSQIIGWNYSSYLSKKNGAVNDIIVTSDGIGNFTVYFNNKPAATFSDSSFIGGDCGYILTIGTSSQENFSDSS